VEELIFQLTVRGRAPVLLPPPRAQLQQLRPTRSLMLGAGAEERACRRPAQQQRLGRQPEVRHGVVKVYLQHVACLLSRLDDVERTAPSISDRVGRSCWSCTRGGGSSTGAQDAACGCCSRGGAGTAEKIKFRKEDNGALRA
jgi:hypothetical protein